MHLIFIKKISNICIVNIAFLFCFFAGKQEPNGNLVAEHVFCPISGKFRFTYTANNGQFRCDQTLSELSNCPLSNTLGVKFRQCSFADMGECLHKWIVFLYNSRSSIVRYKSVTLVFREEGSIPLEVRRINTPVGLEVRRQKFPSFSEEFPTAQYEWYFGVVHENELF